MPPRKNPWRTRANRAEFDYYTQGVPDQSLARSLRVTPATVRAWRSGKAFPPWWTTELLRLKQMEFDSMMRAVGYRRLGICKPGQSAQVYTFAPIRGPAIVIQPNESEALRA